MKMPPQTTNNEPNRTIKEMYSTSRSDNRFETGPAEMKDQRPASGTANRAATLPLFTFASHQAPAKTGNRAIASEQSSERERPRTRGSRSPSGTSIGGTPGT